MDFCKNIFFKWQTLGPIVDQYPCNFKEKITNPKIAQDKNNKLREYQNIAMLNPNSTLK